MNIIVKPILQRLQVLIIPFFTTFKGEKCTHFLPVTFPLGFHSQEPRGKVTGFQNTKASQNNELYNPVTMGICPEKSFDYAGLSNEETVDAKEELGEIDEARGAKFKCN